MVKYYLLISSFVFSSSALAQMGASEAGKSAGDSQGMAQMASQLMGAMLMPTCAQQPPPPTCPMGLMAMAQAGSLGGTKKGAYNAGQIMQAGQSGTPDTLAGPGGALEGGVARPDTSAARKELKKMGYELSADGAQLTLPNGKTIPSASFATDAGMSAAGFSEAQISDAKVKLAEAQAKVSSKLKSLEGGSEGGGGGSGLKTGGGLGSSMVYHFGSSRKKDRSAPNLSGMSKNFGNDKIGVAGDNIFEMITRRYKSQDDSNLFFKN